MHASNSRKQFQNAQIVHNLIKTRKMNHREFVDIKIKTNRDVTALNMCYVKIH